jgi:putative salt-induced outer membrane protein
MLKRAILAGIFLVSPIRAFAQAGAPHPPPPRQEVSAEFAFIGTTGNSTTQTIGLSGEVIERPDVWTLTIKAQYVRNEADDIIKAQSGLFSFEAARALTSRVSTFARYGFLHDSFAGIANRNLIEAGLSDLLVDAAPHRLTVDAGFGYAHEERTNGIDLSNGTFGAGALYKLKLSDTADVSDDVRVLFSLAQGADWRSANIAAVTATLTTILSLKVSNTVRYVNAPVPTFQKTDTITAIALVVKF